MEEEDECLRWTAASEAAKKDRERERKSVMRKENLELGQERA